MAQMNAAPQISLPQRAVACQMLLASGQAVHHGNLRRRNMVNRHLEKLASIHLFKWPRNYVVLLGGCLYFYKCETDSKPCRATSLYGFTSVSMCQEEVSHEIPWPFKLVNALDDRDRTYYFSAASQKELQGWFEAINQQIAVANRLCFPPFQQPGTPMPQAYPTQECAFPPPQQMGYPVLPQPGFPDKPRSNSDSNIQSNTRTLPARPLPVPTIETEYVSDLSSDDDPDYDLPDDMVPNAKTPDKPIPARFQKTNTLPARPVTVNQTQPTEVKRIPKVPTDNSAPVESNSKQVPVKIPTPFTQNSQGIENKPPPKPFKPGGKTVAEIQPTIAKKQDIAAPRKPNVPSRPEDSQVCSVYETVSGMPDVKKLVLDEPEVSSAYWKGESDEGENIMKTLQTNGIYMLRDSKESTEWLPMLTLMVRVDNMVRKYKINNNAGKFSLESTGPHFESTGQLLHHYKSNFLPHRNTKLTKPYTSVWKG